MKPGNLYIKIGGVILLTYSLCACKKFVTIEAPISQLVTASVFNNNAAATSAQAVIYAQMVNLVESYKLSQNTGLLGDELTNYASSGDNLLFFTNALSPLNYTGPWQSAYNYIYEANAILTGLQNTDGVSVAVRKQLTGESKFIRAFWYFYLTNLYGDIPLTTTTDYSINAALARSPILKVYEQVIADLKDAENMLNTNYVDASDTTISLERVRPTSWAAEALLARVYLYTSDYQHAESQASAVISNAAQYKLVPLDSVFLKNSNEAIWQLAIPLPTTRNTYDGQQYILLSAPGNVAISQQLLGSFEGTDMRKTKWINSITTTAPADTFHYPFKYKVQSSPTGSVSEYVMVLRLAEQYLIRAEAKAQLNKIDEALLDLNVIRSRAGLPDYAGATDKASVLSAIFHERQVELFTEWGHRWFDLIRTGNINLVMGGPTGVCQSKMGVWNSDGHQTLYPIPQPEISKDPKLIQNQGY